MIQDHETADQMATDLEQVDLHCLGAEAMFTSYDELNKGNDIDKEGKQYILIHCYCCKENMLKIFPIVRRE